MIMKCKIGFDRMIKYIRCDQMEMNEGRYRQEDIIG